MKKVCLILVLVLLLGLCPAANTTASAAEANSPNFVLDDFSAEEIAVGVSGTAEVQRVEKGAGSAKGAAHITAKTNYASLNYDFGARKDQTYDISAWIKVDETPLIDRVQFVIYNDGADGSKNLYNIVTASNPGLEADKWVKVSAVYTCDGKGKATGVAERIETVPVGSLQLRIGSGVLAETMESGVISYTVDDITVIPREMVAQPVTAENLISNGSFEADSFMDSWYSGGLLSAEISEIAGANGTESAANITILRDWGTIYQDNVDMRFGRQYQISFWAKATSDDAVGLPIEFILTRMDGKVDTAIPNYEYVSDSDDPILASDWKYYEMTYVNNLRTADGIVPNFRFRAGEGTERVSFAVDEVEIYEIDYAGILQTVGKISGSPKHGSLHGYIATGGGLTEHCVFRILAPFEGETAILRSGTELHNEFSLAISADVAYEELEFVGQSLDYDGNVGAVYKSNYKSPESAIVATAEFNETVWNNDIPSLTARVSYLAEESCGTLFTSVAYYSEAGQLLSVCGNSCEVAENGSGTKEYTIPNNTEAAKAKLFLWQENSASPVQTAAEIDKITNARFIYIDPVNGSNNVTGSYLKPLKSLRQARTFLQQREIGKEEDTDIYLIFHPGEYPITDTQSITTSESSETVNVIYTSYNKNNKARFTGGEAVAGFALYDSEKNIYRAKVADGTESRQLFVNGVRAVKAKNNGPLTDAVNIKQLADGTYITAADVGSLEAGTTYTDIGIQTSDTFLKDYKRVEDIELVFYESWTNPRCQVSSVIDNGDGTVILAMDAVGWKAMSNKGGTSVTTPVYIENAIELLDEEGEWYLDTVEDYVYYKPRFFENIAAAEVIMPTEEKLFTISGTSVSAPIRNIRFDNIEFTQTTWMRPSTANGHSDAQNNHIRQNGDHLPDAAIEVTNAYNVDFTNCSFNRMGITALKMTGAIRDCDIIGNEFYEISGSAINFGDISGTNVVNPTDELYFIINNSIRDNYIHKYGVDFKSAAGLSLGFPKNTNVVNNEIYSGAYSGMHVGYGWASYEATGTGTVNLHLSRNYIHNVLNDNLYDGGGIYTLGATGGTKENPNLMSENYFEDIGNMHGAIYPDEGSSFWKISNNVIDMSMNGLWTGKLGTSSKIPTWLHLWTSSIHDIVLENNYSTTQNRRNNGTNIDMEEAILPVNGVWQPEAQAIIDNAGVTSAHIQNFKYGLQRIELPAALTLQAGDAVRNAPVCYTRKGKLYPLANVEIYISSSNPAVATADAEVITTHAAGETVLTYYFLEQGMLKSLQTTVTVTE